MAPAAWTDQYHIGDRVTVQAAPPCAGTITTARQASVVVTFTSGARLIVSDPSLLTPVV